MTAAVVELNDQSLLIQAEGGDLLAEPGYARLTAEGIETGEAARSVAWREPQHVYNQFWCQLNQTALPIRHRFARHHADIAFAQLRHLWSHAGSPESLMVLAPGSFAHAQLALTAGMIQSLPARVDAVVDSGLAACLEDDGDSVYVDVQMHEAVVTACRRRDETVEIRDQEVFPGFGMVQLHNAVARHISNRMIESYRFDPLHSSDAEQAIYDEMPGWLNRLGWESDLSVTLHSGHGEHPCILNRSAVRSLFEDRFSSVRSFLHKWRQARLKLSPVSAVLGGLIDDLAEAEVVGPHEAVTGCLSRYGEITGQVGDLARMRSLNLPRAREARSRANGADRQACATHLLYGDLAFPLDHPVSIVTAQQNVRLVSGIEPGAAVTVVRKGNALDSLHTRDGARVPKDCLPGASIRLGEHEFRLIRVKK